MDFCPHSSKSAEGLLPLDDIAVNGPLDTSREQAILLIQLEHSLLRPLHMGRVILEFQTSAG